MECPVCSNHLSKLTAGNIELDVCQGGCGGVWFDEHELHKFDEPHEFSDSAVLNLRKGSPSNGLRTKARPCPKCDGEVLVRQFIDEKNQVEMDQCWNCAGIWLDVGELNTLRNQYKTYEERKAAVNAYVGELLSERKKALAAFSKEQAMRYGEETENSFKAGVYAFKRLLGLKDPEAW